MSETPGPQHTDYEIAIVGAGVTGLAAASVLGRCGRKTVVLGPPDRENDSAPAVHNFPYDEGVPPSKLYARMEDELARLQVAVLPTSVVGGCIDEDRRRVVLETASGPVAATRVLLANGVEQRIPAWVPDGTWGTSVFLCPFCHAHQHSGQDFLIAGPPVPMTLEVALLCTPHARTLTVVVPDAAVATGPLADRIRATGGDVLVDTIAGATVRRSGQLAVRTGAGRDLVVGAVIPFGITRMHADLTRQLGLRTNEVGIPEVDEDGRASHPLVWIAGNAAKPHYILVEAMGSGLRAAMSMHKDLALEGLG